MRRAGLLAALLAVLAAVCYSAYWLYAANRLREGVGPWAEGLRTQGYRLDWRSVELGGFPLAFRLRLDGAALHAGRPFAYEVTADAIEASTSPFDLERWRFETPPGATVIAATDLAEVAASRLEGEVALADDGTRLRIAMGALAGRGVAEGLAAQTADLRIVLPAGPPASHHDTALEASLDATRLTLPPVLAEPARTIDALSLAASFKGALPPGALAPALARWRDDGGTLEIDRAHLAWGGATLELDGTLALDAAMQPEGAFTATITGTGKLVDAVVAWGALKPRYAGFAKSVLRAIAGPDEADADTIHVPVTLQDQRLYVGPAVIASLPRIDWR